MYTCVHLCILTEELCTSVWNLNSLCTIDPLLQAYLYSVVDAVEDIGLVLAKGLKGRGNAEGTPLVKPNIGELFCCRVVSSL